MNLSLLNPIKKFAILAIFICLVSPSFAQITLKIPKIKINFPKSQNAQQQGNTNSSNGQVKKQSNKAAVPANNDYFFTTHPPKRNAQGYIVASPTFDYQETPEYDTKTLRNILTKDKDENEFLRQMLIYNANNKKGNTALYHCDEQTVSIKVLARGADSLPTQVMGDYNYVENPAVRFHIFMLYDAGLPYYFSFPGEKLYPRSPDEDGVLGHFKFTSAQLGQIVRLNDRDAEARAKYRAAVINPKVNDSLMEALKKKFPGPECSACLVRTVTSKAMVLTKEFVDGYGNKSHQDENFTRYTITITNKCAKNIKVVGISQGTFPGGKQYEQVWKRYSAKQVIQWTRDSNDVAGGMISSILFGGGETADIDLSHINKKYDTEAGDDIQYLFIVEDK